MQNKGPSREVAYTVKRRMRQGRQLTKQMSKILKGYQILNVLGEKKSEEK